MIVQSLKMAWHSITSNKMRSFLTMLGIIIGVVSLVVLVSIVNGATSSVTDRISSMGTNLLTVSVKDNKENPLKLDEVKALADEKTFSASAPVAQTSATAKNGSESESITLYGTTGSYYDIKGLELGSGRFLKAADVDNNTYTVVLNEYAAEALLGSTNVVGETVSLDGKKFLVTGILTEEESTVGSTSERLEGYIPYTTAMRMADDIYGVSSFVISSADENSMDIAEAELTSFLMDRFGQDEDAFSIQNQSTLMETMSSVTNTMALMLGGIAAISLVVGGIGIMNIMLVSVTERTREIGIRKAIGANRSSIMMQFLIEALVISMLGCIIGIILSWVILRIAMLAMGNDMQFTLSLSVVWVAVAFSVFIGVVFGIYPANKAAKKHPIEALRFS